MGRFSLRSFTSVCTFLSFAIVGYALKRPETPYIGNYTDFMRRDSPFELDPTTQSIFCSLVSIVALLSLKQEPNKVFGTVLSGIIFTLGLCYSRMVASSKLNGFLDVANIWRGTYDPTLVFVMGAGVPVSLLSYQLIKGKEKPICATKFGIPTYTEVDRKLVFGSVLFGLGMGMAGWCPGPAIFHAAAGNQGAIFYFLPTFFAGAWLAKQYNFLYA